MPQHLQELSLDKLKRLGTILQQTTSIDTVEHIDPPAISADRMAPLQHRLSRLTTKVTENDLIVAYPTASIACPLNPPIPHPGHPQCSPRLTTKVITNDLIVACLTANIQQNNLMLNAPPLSPPAPVVQAPMMAPPPRVAPLRWSTRLAAKSQRLEPPQNILPPTAKEEPTQGPTFSRMQDQHK